MKWRTTSEYLMPVIRVMIKPILCNVDLKYNHAESIYIALCRKLAVFVSICFRVEKFWSHPLCRSSGRNRRCHGMDSIRVRKDGHKTEIC